MNMSQVEKDVEEAINIMYNGVSRIDSDGKVIYFEEYDSVYPYNNEDINYYYSNFNYNGSILAVASSGDHMLHSILAGSDDITLFDINKLTKYYCNLKLAGAKMLTYEEFFEFFGKENSSAPNFICRNLYEKLKPALSNEDKYYWDSLYNNNLINKKRRERLFNLISIPSCNAYYEKDKFYELQKILIKKEIKIKFIHSNVLDLPNHLDKNKKYTSIFLSNIVSYMYDDNLEFFINLVRYELYNMLDKDGLIALGFGIVPIYACEEQLSNVYVLRKK